MSESIEITEAMIEAGDWALEDWAQDYGVDDLPARAELIRSVLQAALSQRHLADRQDTLCELQEGLRIGVSALS